MTNRNRMIASLLLCTAVAAPITASSALGESRATPGERCAALGGTHMGDVAITAATYYPERRELPGWQGGPPTAMPPHCLVEGMINERTGAGGNTYGIGFELALPADWNGRYLLQGGGGLNGSIRPAVGPVAAGARNALSRGFAVTSHDSGHKGAGFDSSFMADQRAALDFAEASVRTVTLATRELVQSYYGEAPHHSYMTGCSTGGREGMLASQRYPELFDGIVVGAPAMRPGFSNLSAEYAQVLLNRTLPAGAQGPAGFTPAELSLVSSELARQCDAQDGLADGIIANVEGCRSFDADALTCEAGQTDGCIAADRVEAMKGAMAGYRDATGRTLYLPYPWDTGITYSGPGLPGFLPVGQPSPFGPASTARDIDIDERIHQIRWDATGRLTDTAYWTNLSTFLDHGGKMLFFHGVSDPWFSAFDTWDWFQRAGQTNGERWDDAARFYMVPGMMHCQGGDSYEQFDLLGPLVEWVEEGKAPASIPASRGPASNDDSQMKLCPHPQYAHFDGGPEGVASSYSCRMPES